MVIEQYGRNLEAYASRKPLKPHTVYQVAIQILNSIEVIHKSGIVHCDIKPENITIGQNFECSD